MSLFSSIHFTQGLKLKAVPQVLCLRMELKHHAESNGSNKWYMGCVLTFIVFYSTAITRIRNVLQRE